MKEYFVKNKKNITFIFILTIFLYIIRITQYSFSIDTEVLINDPDSLLNSWYVIGRYGLCFFKILFHTKNINIFLTNISAVFFLITNAILWLYLYSTIFRKESSSLANIVFMLMITSSPILCEQIGFTLQALEIMLALNLEAIAILLANKWVKDNKYIYCILSIICLIICFSFYQAYVFLFMTGVITCLLLKYEDDYIDYKELFSQLFKYIFIFVVAFLAYFLINNFVLSVLELEKGTYLTNQIKWGIDPIVVNIKNIITYSIKTLIGYQNTWHPFYGVIFILFFYNYCISKEQNFKTKLMKIFLCISLFIIPFILIVLTASQTAGRAQFSIVYSLAFMTWWLLQKLKEKKIVILLVSMAILQCCVVSILNFSAYNCFKEEKKLVEDVSQEIINKNYENKQIAFIGKYNPNTCLKGETLGHSFFEWDYLGGLLSNNRIKGLTYALGYDYQFAEDKLSYLTEAVKGKETWFENHNIYLIDDIVVIKLS